MKISRVESSKAAASAEHTSGKILPKDRPKGSVASRVAQARKLSPLEQGIAAAEEALAAVPDTRDELVEELKQRIEKGQYQVSGEEIAEMMLRRRAADRLR